MQKVFTFWEGRMPAYIEMCMQTWKFPYIILTYDNLHNYTDMVTDDRLQRFSLPMIADVVRAHVLRDNGGYWLDTDTIILDELPKENIKGYPESRDHTWGYLFAEEPNMDFFIKWSRYQDGVLDNPNCSYHWSTMCEKFTNPYIHTDDQLTISPIRNSWPETYMIPGDMMRWDKYRILYFEKKFKLSDFEPTDMLMLHNSWTPDEYKKLSRNEVLSIDCTLSNILGEVV